MASFNCYIPTNIFGKGSPSEFVGSPPEFALLGDEFLLELDFPEFYELFGGTFTHSSELNPSGHFTPSGEVTVFGVYDYDNTITRFWDAEGEIYDATTIYNLTDSGSWRDFFEYILSSNDEIYGSHGKDKLDGYQGNDYIDGNKGNDKLKGGLGLDQFFFQRSDGRDTIKDFSRANDAIWLDDGLASDMSDVREAASAYKDGVILDFGNDEIKIEGLKLSKLSKVEFDF